MMRILIVEDEIILAMNVQMELEQLGHEVVGIAKNSTKAITIIEKDKPDLILMDIVIQGEINGMELTSIVNQKYGIPVIYRTAHMDEATINKVNQTEHCGILTKPTQLNELSAAINKAIDKGSV